MKLFNLFILCLFSNLCFGNQIKLRFFYQGYKNGPHTQQIFVSDECINEDELRKIEDNKNIDEIVTFLQLNCDANKGNKNKKKFYNSLNDKNNLNRKLFIYIQNYINSEKVKQKFIDEKLSQEYYICEINLYKSDSKEVYQFQNDLNTIAVIIHFSYTSYEIKNCKYIQKYETYFLEDNINEDQKNVLKFWNNLIDNKSKYFYLGKNYNIVKTLQQIGIGFKDFVYTDNNVKLTLYPFSEQLIKPINISIPIDTKTDNVVKIKVDKYSSIKDFFIKYKDNFPENIKNYKEFFGFYDINGIELTDDDEIDCLMYLKLKKVYLKFLRYNSSKEEYIQILGYDNEKDIDELKDYFNKIKEEYDTNVSFKLRLCNDEKKTFFIDNKLTDELIETIKQYPDPDITIIIGEEPKKEVKKIEKIKEEHKKEEPKEGENNEGEHKEEENKEESKKEESKIEESKKEESKIEESKKEESKIEEPKKEESKKEESKIEEPKKEEPKKEEPKKEEPKKEEPKKEESKIEESKIEESKIEESKIEEPEKVDFKKEEPKIEEIKKEGTKKVDFKKEEPNGVDLKKVKHKKEKPEKVDLKKEGNNWKVINNPSNSKSCGCCRCRN